MTKRTVLILLPLILLSLFLIRTVCSSGKILNLFDAVVADDAGAVNRLIAGGENPNEKNDMGDTPLALAAAWGNIHAVSTLLHYAVDVNSQNKDDRTALMAAAVIGHEGIVRRLLSARAKIDIQDFRGQTALALAVMKNRQDTAELLIDKGADINIKDNEGKTPLFTAAFFNHAEMVRLLIEHGAKVEERNHGSTPLMYAVRYGGPETVKVLIEKGAKVNAQNDDGHTALADAIEKGSTESFHILLRANADVKLLDPLILILAAVSGNPEIMDFLLSKGFDVNARSRIGETALRVATTHEHEEIVKTLIAKGAEVNQQDENGWSPLTWASDYGLLNMAKILIQNHANVDQQDKEGWTPLMHAAEDGHTKAQHAEVVRTLLQKGADPNIKNTKGKTALDYTKDASIRAMLIRARSLPEANDRTNASHKDIGAATKTAQ